MARSKSVARKERWRQIPGCSWYDVSSLGRVRTWKPTSKTGKARARAKLMKLRKDSDGYWRVTLQSDAGKKVVKRIHILVARAFLGPARGRLVLHKNGKNTDNKLSNLEYGSYQDNNDDKYSHGTHGMGEQNSQASLTRKKVKEIYRLKGRMTQVEIAKKFRISRQAVSDIHRGETWAEVTGA